MSILVTAKPSLSFGSYFLSVLLEIQSLFSFSVVYFYILIYKQESR